MSMRKYIFLILLLLPLIARAQDPAEYKGTVRVFNKYTNEDVNIGKSKDIIFYGHFPSRERAEKVKRGLEQITNSQKKAGSFDYDPNYEKKVKAFRESNNLISRVRGNGSFSKMCVPGYCFVFFFEEADNPILLIEVDDPKKDYTCTFNINRMRNVTSTGKKKDNDSIGGGVAGDPDDGNEYFPIRFKLLGPGAVNPASRIIIQTYAVDCQTEDTVAYLKPVVYEGTEYHDLQNRRKGYNYYANDSLSRGYNPSMLLNYDDDVVIDTMVVFPKEGANKVKSFKGPFKFVIEDYHHVYKIGGWGGTCLRERPFKFLDFNVATSEMELTEDFREPAEENISKQDRKLNLRFDVGKDELSQDSLNQVMLQNLTDELRAYGELLMNVSIEGAASPDGATKKNEELARQRARTALNLISSRVGRGKASSAAPKVKVYEWTDVADALEKNGHKVQAEEVRSIALAHPGDEGDPLIYKLTYYKDTIGPVLESLRSMRVSYMYQRAKIMSPSECREFYYEQRKAGEQGRLKLSQLSEGDFFNLYSIMEDTADIDTITKIAYQKIIKGYDYQYESRIAPYVANKMALLSLKEGMPDANILNPFIDYTMKGVDAEKWINDATKPIVNRADHLLNQAIIYFQQQKMDSCNYLIRKLEQANRATESVQRVKRFMDLKRLHYNRNRNNADEADYQAAKEFVLESSEDNKAILYTEIKDWGMRDQAPNFVDAMDDNNPKKWYLMALLAVERAGTEADEVHDDEEDITVPVAEIDGQKLLNEDQETDLMMNDPAAYALYQRVKGDLEAKQKEINLKYAEEEEKRRATAINIDSIPTYLAYFHHCFELQPSYKRLYFNEGHVDDQLRKKYKYRIKDIPKYKKVFELLMKKREAERAEKALPEEEEKSAEGKEAGNGEQAGSSVPTAQTAATTEEKKEE